jgi:hypothetical protein
MYHTLKEGEVYRVTSRTKAKDYIPWTAKFIVTREVTNNYGYTFRYEVRILEQFGFNFYTDRPTDIDPKSNVLNSELYDLIIIETEADPINKEAAHSLINHMLKHEALKQDNKEWFNDLCNENKNLA